MTTTAIEPAGAADAAGLAALLHDAGLPTDGLFEHLATALVARDAGRIVGSAALEIYPDGALLRSVAVDASMRGTGLGVRLVEAALALAASRHAPAVYLLTTTAGGYFPRFGFTPIQRAEVPESVRQSVEFTTVCCASALVMRRTLEPAVSPFEPGRI